jgi:hypothetical protein
LFLLQQHVRLQKGSQRRYVTLWIVPHGANVLHEMQLGVHGVIESAGSAANSIIIITIYTTATTTATT